MNIATAAVDDYATAYMFKVDVESLPVTIDFVVQNKADTTDHIAVNPTGLLVSNLKFTVDNMVPQEGMSPAPEPKGWSMMFEGALAC